jgi:flagellar hook protein FlgE
MFGAIYVGLSGLQAYSEGLQAVSNNVANLNSLGFKSSSVSFANVQGARDTGGIGLAGSSGGSGGGVGLAEPTLDLRAGELRQTENDLDLAVEGTGFLVLLKGSEVRYVRTGSFEVDEDGFVALSGTGWRLATLDGGGRPVALSIDASRTSVPIATTVVGFADNLSSTATTHSVNDLAIYDANGVKHVWQVSFTREEGATDWTIKVVDESGATIGEETLAIAAGAPTAATSKLTFADVASGLSVLFDFSNNVTSFSSGTVSTLRAANVDGHGAGSVTTLAVNDKGELEIGYSNDEKQPLGAVALATFRDPQALRQESGGLFVSDGHAQVEYLAGEDARVGAVLSRRLEASNVDLSREFGDLILIQRGYQASSQIISVSNDMIQQLFGIRGQG